MANPSKRKGSWWETATADFLNGEGIFAERIPAGATLDRGDLYVVDWTVEAKNQNAMSLGAWLDETVREQANRNTPWHLLAVKRRGKGAASEGFAVMTMAQAARLILTTTPAARLAAPERTAA